MKKIMLSFFMVVVLLTSTITAMADKSTPTGVGYSETYKNVYKERR